MCNYESWIFLWKNVCDIILFCKKPFLLLVALLHHIKDQISEVILLRTKYVPSVLKL